MKVKALYEWPPQQWKSDGKKTLAPEDALDATDVSASVQINGSSGIALRVMHNDQSYRASLSVPEDLGKRVALVISGAGPNKTLREIGELEIESEAPVS
jgi:hypothetical protein